MSSVEISLHTCVALNSSTIMAHLKCKQKQINYCAFFFFFFFCLALDTEDVKLQTFVMINEKPFVVTIYAQKVLNILVIDL